MNFSMITFFMLLGNAAAFAPSAAFTRNSKTVICMSANEINRSDFVKTLTAGSVFAAFSSAQPAMAAKYGAVGKGSPNVMDPKEAIVDSEILASEAVQKSLASIKLYAKVVAAIKGELVKNPQADIAPYIRKNFDFSILRGSLNNFNTVFDEDTQRGTDRIIRIIIQDVDELEVNSRLKEGIPRSERRLLLINGKLNKLEKAFKDFLAFA